MSAAIASSSIKACDKRLMQLDAPQWVEMQKAIADIKDARAAWERLGSLGLFPHAWLGPDAPRVFGVGAENRMRERGYPGSPAQAAFVAAAQETLSRVETLAFAIAKALEPWGQSPPTKVIWHFLLPGKLKQKQLRGEYAVCDALHLASLHAGQGCAARGFHEPNLAAELSSQPGRSAAQHIFAHDVGMYENWMRALAFDATLPRGPFWQRHNWFTRQYEPVCMPESLVGKRVRDLDDPFRPLLGIWEAGCVLHTISPEGILLCAQMPTAP